MNEPTISTEHDKNGLIGSKYRNGASSPTTLPPLKRLFSKLRCALKRHQLRRPGLVRLVLTRYFLPIFFLLFVCLVAYKEERHYGLVLNYYLDFYIWTARLPITRHRNALPPAKRKHISVVLVINQTSDLYEYQYAFRTLEEYCALQQYELLLIDFSQDPTLQLICPQTDIMFRRHCAIIQLLKDRQPSDGGRGHRSNHGPSKSGHNAGHGGRLPLDYVIFLDTDMAVINPNHLLEDYLSMNDPNEEFDMIFQERLLNGEIAAGTYIAKNTQFSIDLLSYWANYFYRLPRTFHGTDNAAIHAVFVELFCGPNCSTTRWERTCMDNIWRKSASWDDVIRFSACAHSVLGKRNVFRPAIVGYPHRRAHPNISDGQVRLVTDFRKYWQRDGWITGNQWAPSDFILHGWQVSRLNQNFEFYGWHPPIVFTGENGGAGVGPGTAKLWTIGGGYYPFRDSHSTGLSAVSSSSSGASGQSVWLYKTSFIATTEWVMARLAGQKQKMRLNSMELVKQIEMDELKEFTARR